MAAQTILDHVALTKVSEKESVSLFMSDFHPGWMGNTAMIAYGGCTLAIGVAAACKTVQDGFHLYSTNGNYLGPAQTDRKYQCKVTRIRDTRTFATRYVEVSQEFKGSQRLCLSMLADFQKAEPASMMEYTAPTTQKWPKPADCLDLPEYREQLVKEGKISQRFADAQGKTFNLMQRSFVGRMVPDSMLHTKLFGIAKHLPTPQDKLPLTSRTTAEWLKARDALLQTQAQNVAALAFNIDGALSFIPLIHDHMSLEDAGPCSSLDFAIRIMSNNVDLNQWHLKEIKTHHGSNGRTYSEARIWDEEGTLVAVMTQTNILRPKPAKEGAVKAKPSL